MLTKLICNWAITVLSLWNKLVILSDSVHCLISHSHLLYFLLFPCSPYLESSPSNLCSPFTFSTSFVFSLQLQQWNKNTFFFPLINSSVLSQSFWEINYLNTWGKKGLREAFWLCSSLDKYVLEHIFSEFLFKDVLSCY